MTRYLTVAEAGQLLGLTRQQTNNLVKARVLRPVKKRVLRRRDVERLAARRAKRKAREQAERERQRALEAKLEAVRREFEAKGGGVDGGSDKV